MKKDIKVICAAVTPFTEAGELDRNGLPHLFRAIKESGIDAVFTPGTTGEFTALDAEERLAVIAAALEVFGADGVYAHVGAASGREAARLARAAFELGARRLAAITPYFVTAGPAAVADYYRAIAEAVPEAEIYVYIFQARATTDVTPEQLAELSRIPGIVGAKISGLPTDRVAEYIAAVDDDFVVYSGNDREFIPVIQAGGNGIVTGVSGVFPAPFIAAKIALSSGEKDLRKRQRDIDEAVERTGGGDFGMLKLGTQLRGLPSGPLRIALDPVPTETAARLRGVFLDEA